jgi:hypothetical protein
MMNSQELAELGWDIYRINNWVARHRDSGRKITAGTFYTLLQLVNYEEDMKQYHLLG